MSILGSPFSQNTNIIGTIWYLRDHDLSTAMIRYSYFSDAISWKGAFCCNHLCQFTKPLSQHLLGFTARNNKRRKHKQAKAKRKKRTLSILTTICTNPNTNYNPTIVSHGNIEDP